MKAILLALVASFSFAASAKVQGKTKPVKSESAVLNVWSYQDYDNRLASLEKPKLFKFDLAAVEKYHPEFYIFIESYEQVDRMCFEGSAHKVAEIIDAILAVSTGDAYVYPKTARVTESKITQHVKYEDESGYNDFDLEVMRCE